MQVNKGETN